jgi:hypothetical protein
MTVSDVVATAEANVADRHWIVASWIGMAVVSAVCVSGSYYTGYNAGYERGKHTADAETHRQVHQAHAECRVLIESQRAWYEGLHDRASVIWETNTRALLSDMAAYERDLEHCRRIR